MAVAPVGATTDIQKFESSTTSGAGVITHTTGAKPAGMAVAVNDLLLMFVSWNGTESTTMPATPTGWTVVVAPSISGVGIGKAVFRKTVTDAVAEQAATYSITHGTACRGAIGVRAYRGVDLTTPLDATPVGLEYTGTAGPRAITSAAITTVTTDAFLSSYVGVEASTLVSVAITSPAEQIWNLAGRRQMYAEGGLAGAAGSKAGLTWQQTDSGSITYSTYRFALRPATGGAAVTPAAGFTGTPLSGAAPLAVQFTDTSTNTPTSWAWTFGDGTTSTAQNPAKTYTAAGTYTVALTATNSAGSNTVTKTGYVTVTAAPQVLLPASTITSSPTAWAITGAATAHAALADSTDTTYVTSPTLTGTASVLEVKLAAGTDPTVNTGHVIDYTYQSVAATTTVSLVVGTTVISSQVVTADPTTFTTGSFTLTATEAAAIRSTGAGYADLRLRFSAVTP